MVFPIDGLLQNGISSMYRRMLVEVISSGVETNTILNAGSKPSIGKSEAFIRSVVVSGVERWKQSGSRNLIAVSLMDEPSTILLYYRRQQIDH